MKNTTDTTPPQTAGAPGSASGEIIHKLTHGEPEGWPDPVAMQEAWERDDAIELVTDKRIARKYADSIIEWIAGPVPWQEWERVDMADAILRAIHEARGIAPSEQNHVFGPLEAFKREQADNATLRAKLAEWIQPCFCTGRAAKCLMCETRELLQQNMDSPA